MSILITGIAGFIGFNFAEKYLKKYPKDKIIGVDNLNNYYSTSLKLARLARLKKKIKFYKIDISNKKALKKIFKNHKIHRIYNFAAQAGVRYSINHPSEYQKSNIEGFYNILEFSRLYKVKELIYASSSSVYGENKNFPLKENEKINPKNFYGLTKKINEQMAEVYSNHYKIKTIGLRFFTVYGEWGRPDMSIFKIIDSSFKKKIFYLNNYGNHDRDFTYIDDVVNVLLKLKFNKNNHEIYNICSNKPINLKKLLKIIGKYISLPRVINRKMQIADVIKTHGSNLKVSKLTKSKKYTDLDVGIKNVINWYKNFYYIRS